MRKVLLAVAAVPVVAVVAVLTVMSLSALAVFSAAVAGRNAGGGGAAACVDVQISGGWANPLAGVLTSGYGPRQNPFGPGIVPAGFASESELTMHAGQDIAGVPERTPFYSASDGTVKAVDQGGAEGGNGLIVDAGGGVEIWYWHAATGSSKVRVGQQVTAGTELAGVGSTGASTAAHLHFEIHVDGEHVDPVAFMAERGITLGSPGPEQTAPAPETGLTAFTSDQRAAAVKIVETGRALGVPRNGLVISLMVALQESSLKMYANSAIPESMALPHTAVGSDHDSVGLFQQRPAAGWGTVPELMDIAYSARAFFGGPEGPNAGAPRGLLDIAGWEQIPLGTAAQAVQVSAFPDAYDKWRTTAEAFLEDAGGSVPTQCTPGAITTAATVEEPAGVREKILGAARQGLGHPYLWGGSTPDGWDCSGYVNWVYAQAGITLPRTNQWEVGEKTSDPQPGDLVVQRRSGPTQWEHVGIYAGPGTMYSALNPTDGTKQHGTDIAPDTEYFRLITR